MGKEKGGMVWNPNGTLIASNSLPRMLVIASSSSKGQWVDWLTWLCFLLCLLQRLLQLSVLAVLAVFIAARTTASMLCA